MSRLVVMGSGETAPTMVRVHREVFASCPDGPAVMLDTPFAFQTNRAELVARTQSYFAQSLGRDVEVAAWSGAEDPAQQEKSLALLDRAAWAFAGPGSPTYALRRWRGTPVPSALLGVVRRGGTVVVVGVYAAEVMEVQLGVWWARALTIRFIGLCPVHAWWERTMDEVVEGRLDPAPLISHRLPLEDAARGYELFERREATKVVLVP